MADSGGAWIVIDLDEFVVLVATEQEIENTLAEHNAAWFDEARQVFACDCGIGRFVMVNLCRRSS